MNTHYDHDDKRCFAFVYEAKGAHWIPNEPLIPPKPFIQHHLISLAISKPYSTFEEETDPRKAVAVRGVLRMRNSLPIVTTLILPNASRNNILLLRVFNLRVRHKHCFSGRLQTTILPVRWHRKENTAVFVPQYQEQEVAPIPAPISSTDFQCAVRW